MTRINITIDEKLKSTAEIQAKNLGLSLSSFIRLLLVKSVNNNQLSGVDKGLLDLKNGKFKTFNKEQYISALNDMINNAS